MNKSYNSLQKSYNTPANATISLVSSPSSQNFMTTTATSRQLNFGGPAAKSLSGSKSQRLLQRFQNKVGQMSHSTQRESYVRGKRSQSRERKTGINISHKAIDISLASTSKPNKDPKQKSRKVSPGKQFRMQNAAKRVKHTPSTSTAKKEKRLSMLTYGSSSNTKKSFGSKFMSTDKKPTKKSNAHKARKTNFASKTEDIVPTSKTQDSQTKLVENSPEQNMGQLTNVQIVKGLDHIERGNLKDLRKEKEGFSDHVQVHLQEDLPQQWTKGEVLEFPIDQSGDTMDISIPDEYAPAGLRNIKHQGKGVSQKQKRVPKHSKKQFQSQQEEKLKMERENSPNLFYNLSKREDGEAEVAYVEADEEVDSRPSVANQVKESTSIRSPSFESSGSHHHTEENGSTIVKEKEHTQNDPWYPQESTLSKKVTDESKMSQQSSKYLDSLDNFLDANMKTIADLIASKKTLKHEIEAIAEIVKEVDKDAAFQEKQQGVLRTDIANQQEKQGNVELQIEEMALAIEQVKDKIDEKCEHYEGEIDLLYDAKQIKVHEIQEVMNIRNTVERDQDMDEQNAEFHIEHLTERIVLAEKEIKELQRLVDSNKDREGTKIDLIRNKTKLLNQLIRNEDVGDNLNTNISRDIYKIINTYKN